MRLRRIVVPVVCLFSLCLVMGCVSTFTGDKSEVIASSPVRYLKNNIHVQKQYDRKGNPVYKASYANYTNPGAGHMIIPVNTQVQIGESRTIRGRELLIVDQTDGKEIHFAYNIRHMGMSMAEYADLISSPTPVSTEGLSAKDRQGIRDGKAYPGMTKDGVRIALGYPAPHRTPSLNDNNWTYWQNRFGSMVVEFGPDGTVRRIRK